MATTASNSSVTAKLNFLIPPEHGERAFHHINANSKTGERESNYGKEEREVVIEDLRGNEEAATLDTAGFQLVRHPAKHTAFTNDEDVKREYYPESAELLKKVTGASRVVFFDHTIRRRRPGQIDDSPDKRQPVAQAHVDQTTESSIARVHRHVPDDAPELLKHRFQIINLWRPIANPALDWPLGLCDYRSVDPKTDVVPVALIYPDREGETLGVKHSPNHKWKYFRGLTPEEAILIKW
ncbi:hypothetical protein DXG03_003958 [Asterophora parasitica]|uniref:Methyltransferase n=1 Tax=Asterophora parasitica TaxID=117018 RepID=A0A9P7G767_9AGAR|nr:hypothetical protein DXG03_003958 [Asterophora parasitica]